jgi:hypothetical protein
MTLSEASVRILTAKISPELWINVAPGKFGGRGECRMLAAPMARLQQGKQAAVTTGKAGTTGIPRAMALRLIRDLPGVRAC